MRIRLQSIEQGSRANGPGLRATVWMQGCTLGCTGCFNPHTHDLAGGFETTTEMLAAELLAIRGIEGVSISGGEPFQQPEALLDLLRWLAGSGLSTLIFTGYTLKELEAMPLAREILPHIDVLVAGRFVAQQKLGRGMLGSANQRIHLLSGRYTMEHLRHVPETEAIWYPDGRLRISGIHRRDPPKRQA